MGSLKITGNYPSNAVSNASKPQTGQILRGQILKIYPENKALIQLGNQRMSAQLEASLTIGGRYHFLVTSTDEMIRLKVLGELTKSKGKENIAELLNQIGIKVTKHSVALVDELISKKIPFDKQQLVQALQLLGDAKHKPEAIRTILQMLQRNIPISKSIYAALEARNGASSLTDQLKALYQQLPNDSNHRQLVEQLHRLLYRPQGSEEIVNRQIRNEIAINGRDTFNVLQSTGLTSNETKHHFLSEKSLNQLAAPTKQLSNLPQELRLNALEQLPSRLMNMLENKPVLTEEISKVMGLWKTHSQSNNPIPEQLFEQMKQQIKEKIIPLLPVEQRQLIAAKLQNNIVDLRQVFSLLEGLTDERMYATASRLLGRINNELTFLTLPPKEQFLFQLNQQLTSIGLNYEHNITKGLTNEQTIKEMLFQIISNQDTAVREQGQKLLHFINGMQLNSVLDTPSGVVANLLLPGEKLGLLNDLELDFKGKKKEDGKIDPDYCHIVFYLDLANIKHTIIDMNIQKRNINLTVYNDSGLIKQLPENMKSILKKNLDELNYNLTHIQLETSMTTKPKKVTYDWNTNSYKGVDLKI